MYRDDGSGDISPMKERDGHFYLDALIRISSIYLSGNMVSVQVKLQEAKYLRELRRWRNLGRGFYRPVRILMFLQILKLIRSDPYCLLCPIATVRIPSSQITRLSSFADNPTLLTVLEYIV